MSTRPPNPVSLKMLRPLMKVPSVRVVTTVVLAVLGLTACSGGAPATKVDVTGQVVSTFNVPVTDVSVASQGQTITTNDAGEFTLTGLTVPYDLAVWNQAEGWLHVYEGLSSSAPLLAEPSTFTYNGPSYGTTITGSLASSHFPLGSDQHVRLCLSGLQGGQPRCAAVDRATATYSMSPTWFESESVDVTLHGFLFATDAVGSPVSYLGYTTVPLTLRNAVPIVFTDPLELGPALETSEVEVTFGGPVAPIYGAGAVQLAPDLALAVWTGMNPSQSQTVRMPVIPGSTYTFLGAASLLQLGWQAGVTGPSATVNLPPLLVPVTPADTATGVTTGTEFTVASTGIGTNTFSWSHPMDDLVVHVTTTRNTVTIPDLAEYGLTLPAGTTLEWGVLRSNKPLEDGGSAVALDYYGFLMLGEGGSRGLEGSGSITGFEPLEFTTAP